MARILLVEDARHSSAAVLHGLLHDAGHEVEQIADGAAALERILHAPPALTLLEVALPRIDEVSVPEAAQLRHDHLIETGQLIATPYGEMTREQFREHFVVRPH